MTRDKTKVEVVMEYYTKYNNGIESLRKSDLMHAIDSSTLIRCWLRSHGRRFKHVPSLPGLACMRREGEGRPADVVRLCV